MPHVAALLAAGGGTRFTGDTHKLLAPLDHRSVWEHALDHLLEAGFDRVLVVTGAVALELPDTAIGRAELHHNPRWAEGQATSLQLAVSLADASGAGAVTVGLADQPFVTAQAWCAVRDAPTTCRLVVAEYDGTPGPNPVRLGREVWALLPRMGDEGARSLLRAHPEWVCRVACVGSVADIDTLEDLERWRSC